MRLVDRKTFLALPEGTIYAKGKPWAFESLNIKDENAGSNDWWYFEPCWIESAGSHEHFDFLEEMQTKGTSYPMQESISRDGLYDDDAIFLVFERADLLRLRDMIDKAIEVA